MSQLTLRKEWFSLSFFGWAIIFGASLDRNGTAYFRKSASLICSNSDFLWRYPGWTAIRSPGSISYEVLIIQLFPSKTWTWCGASVIER